MARFNGPCRLAALALLAVVTASMHGLSAQAQAPAPASAPAPVRPPESSTPATTPAVPAAVPALPTDPEELGDTLSGHQRYQAAIAAYAKIADPSASVWNKMGIAYQMMFNLKDASRCYNASLKLDPRSALILRNLGSNQLAQHKYKTGWAMYQSALAIDPQIFQTHSGASVENPASTQERGAMHYYMAKGCVTAGNHECAIQNLRLAINEGYISPKKIATDGSFGSLFELPAFQQMIAAQASSQ